MTSPLPFDFAGVIAGDWDVSTVSWAEDSLPPSLHFSRVNLTSSALLGADLDAAGAVLRGAVLRVAPDGGVAPAGSWRVRFARESVSAGSLESLSDDSASWATLCEFNFFATHAAVGASSPTLGFSSSPSCSWTVSSPAEGAGTRSSSLWGGAPAARASWVLSAAGGASAPRMTLHGLRRPRAAAASSWWVGYTQYVFIAALMLVQVLIKRATRRAGGGFFGGAAKQPPQRGTAAAAAARAALAARIAGAGAAGAGTGEVAAAGARAGAGAGEAGRPGAAPTKPGSGSGLGGGSSSSESGGGGGGGSGSDVPPLLPQDAEAKKAN